MPLTHKTLDNFFDLMAEIINDSDTTETKQKFIKDYMDKCHRRARDNNEPTSNVSPVLLDEFLGLCENFNFFS
jgi:hypothetical protein